MSVVGGVGSRVAAAVVGEHVCSYEPEDWLRAQASASLDTAESGVTITIETRVSDLEVRTQNLDLQETTPKAATTPSYIHVYTRKKRSVAQPLHVNIQGIYGHYFKIFC